MSRGVEPQIADAADDAYRYPIAAANNYDVKPPNPVMSNDTADILNVLLAPAAPSHPGHDAAYKVSLAVQGEPHATYNYLIGGQFGQDCYLIHFFKAGETREALASCGSGQNFRIVAKLRGSTVSIRGNTISATFSFRRFTLPSALRSSPEIRNLYSMSCPVTSRSWGCDDDVIDFGWGRSGATFHI